VCCVISVDGIVRLDCLVGSQPRINHVESLMFWGMQKKFAISYLITCNYSCVRKRASPSQAIIP